MLHFGFTVRRLLVAAGVFFGVEVGFGVWLPRFGALLAFLFDVVFRLRLRLAIEARSNRFDGRPSRWSSSSLLNASVNRDGPRLPNTTTPQCASGTNATCDRKPEWVPPCEITRWLR